MKTQVRLDNRMENTKTGEDRAAGWHLSASPSLQPLFASRTNARLDLRSGNEDEPRSNSQGKLEPLDVLLSRYRRVLLLVAHRVLGNREEAEDAVQNCLQTVSNRVPRFDNEGAFRSWLVRVLIDEAVTILSGGVSTPV
jgi:hypothetical protein